MIPKKAIAPIVATLLLLGFAVAIGVVVMNFGRAQVEVTATCAVSTDLHFVEKAGKKQLCYDATKSALSVVLENGQNIKIHSVGLALKGSEGTATQELGDAQMDKGGSYLKNIPYSKEKSGELWQVSFTPKVFINKEVLSCTEQTISLSTIVDC